VGHVKRRRLLDAGTPAYLGPMSHLAVGALLAVPEVEEAFRTGGGVPFSAYGSEVRHGLGLLNGATFDRTLAQWIAAMPDVDQRLRGAHGPAVLDVGCGVGRSALALARAYPNVTVHGIDLDAPRWRRLAPLRRGPGWPIACVHGR
jgi:hypothetical protein